MLVAATLAAWAPLAGVLTSAALASLLDCRVDEAAVHACRAAGLDLGPLLYRLGVGGWLMLATWPLMIATTLIWIGLLIWTAVRRLRSMRAA